VTNVFASSPGGTAPAYPQDATALVPAARDGHEQVVFCQDPQTGLRAIIAIYSTALGPALGGTRFFPYPTEDAALADALNLSRAMAYKNALADLDLGGGKAVIIGDPAKHKSEALLRAYGRFIESLGGRYITACDIGTFSDDMDVVARESRHVTGRTLLNGGGGDSSILTAIGVFHGMRAAAEHTWGSGSLEGRLVGVEGVGKVGHRLVGHLVEAGANVVICDVSPAAVQRVRAAHPDVEAVAGQAELLARPLDVRYAPSGSLFRPRRSSRWRTRRACRPLWPPTGWPSGGWPRSAGSAASGCRPEPWQYPAVRLGSARGVKQVP